MAKRVVGSTVLSSEDPVKFGEMIWEATKKAYEQGLAAQHVTHEMVMVPGVYQHSAKYYQSCVIIWEEADAP